MSNHLQNDIPNPEKMLQQFLNHNEQHTLDVELGLQVYYYLQGLLYYQPKQCIIIREIPENYHRFLLFVSPKMGNIMIPVSTVYVFLGGRISYCMNMSIPALAPSAVPLVDLWQSNRPRSSNRKKMTQRGLVEMKIWHIDIGLYEEDLCMYVNMYILYMKSGM